MSSNQKFKCFIIHLKRAKKRRAYVDEIISKLNIETEIIDAVDGRLLTENKILQYYSEKPLFEPAYPFKINKGEIGCFLSFRKAWQNIVDQNLAGGLIFEDDVSLNLNVFQYSFDTALNWIEKHGYIQFQVRNVSKKIEIIKAYKKINLLKPSPILLRCSAQLVSYSTAKRLLEITERFDRPVDGLLQLNWSTGVEVTTITPSGVMDNTNASGGSNLSLNIPFTLKIKQEYNRIKYRYNIKKNAKIHDKL